MTGFGVPAPSSPSPGGSAVLQLPRYLPSLDGVRGLAILLVLMHNLLILDEPSTRFAQLLSYGLNVGWIGVRLFFVLSGFLITRILLEAQDAPNYYRVFFARRVLRIFPLYYAALLAFFVVWPFFGTAPPKLTQDHSAWLWLYVSNWTLPLGLGGRSMPHFWSLAVEEQFYLIWPFLLHHRSPIQALRLCLGLALLGIGLRIGLLALAVSPEIVYMITPSQFDALALGGALAAVLKLPGALPRLVERRSSLLASAALVALAGLVITHGYPRTSFIGQTLGYALLATVFTLGIAAALGGDCSRQSCWTAWLRAAPLRAVGKYSYAMYVFHKPIHDFIGKPILQYMHHLGFATTQSAAISLAYLGLGTLVTLAAGALSYHLFEKHFLVLKSRASKIMST